MRSPLFAEFSQLTQSEVPGYYCTLSTVLSCVLRESVQSAVCAQDASVLAEFPGISEPSAAFGRLLQALSLPGAERGVNDAVRSVTPLFPQCLSRFDRVGTKPVTTYARDTVLKDLCTLFDQGVLPNLTDGELLERFVSRSGELSENAFRGLVERHGPMVLRVCRNALKDPYDVEDAFQASFMILIRKAGSIRKRGSCASWLHGVALRAAAGIRTAAARRREHERKNALNAAALLVSQAPELPDDLPGVIDEELRRLRDQHRSPLVLCYLEGHTCEEAARQLGWPVGTVKSRLARGRERLRRQLIRRGAAPSLILAAGTDISSPVQATVPASLVTKVLEVSVPFAAHGAVAAALPSTIAALVRAEMRRGAMTRAIRAAMVLVGIGMAMTAAASRTTTTEDGPAPPAKEGPAPKAQPERPKATPSPIHARVVDVQGKPVEGVEVLVFQLNQPVVKVKTDQDGRVVLAQPQANKSFSLMARGRETVAGVTHYAPIPLKGGTAQDPLVLTLTPLTHKVAGSVVDPQGRPIAGVRVTGRGLNYEESNFFLRRQYLEAEGDPLGSGVSDAEGLFTLTLPAETNVTLAFRHPRWVSPRIDVAEDEKSIDPVTLQPAGSITGWVRDRETGAPVAGAGVGAQLLDSPSLTNGEGGGAVSDAQGKFIIESLEEGVYNVCLGQVPGRPRATARAVAAIRVRSGEETPAELKVFDGIPLQGVVIDAMTTQPLPDVLVCGHGPAHPLPGNSMHASYSDERGQFTFFVPPGEHFVSLLISDAAMWRSRLGTSTVTVPENGKVAPIRLVGPVPERPYVDMPGRVRTTITTSVGRVTRILSSSSSRRVVPEGRTVIGKVLDAEGGPLAGATIAARIVTEHSSNTVSTVVSDREGSFIAKGLPRGEVTMIATRPGRVRRKDSLTQVIPGDRSTVDFTFGPAPVVEAPPMGPATDEPVPPSLKDRLTFVNLDPKANEFLADGPGGQGDDLNRLTQGIRAFDGVYYRIGERLIHLRGQAAPALPDTVSAIAVGTRADRVRILHSARGDVPVGTEIGHYTVHYADGTSERVPAVYGRGLGRWYSSTMQPLATPTHARVAWAGSNDVTDWNPGSAVRIHLFAFTWKNPHPQRVIATIDATSTTTESELVLVGITLERDTPK